MRRNSCESFQKRAGIDPKLVSDQLGYGLGVNLDVYTIARVDQRLEAVNIGRLPDRCVLLLITLHGTSAHA